MVSVKDTGVGIAEEDIPLLFSRFGKLQRTASLNSEGIGLGLTIVQQIVELSGGSVFVQSEGVGKGSTFMFSMKMEPANVYNNMKLIRLPFGNEHRELLRLQA